MSKMLSRTISLVLALIATGGLALLSAQASSVTSADAKAWMGDWVLSLELDGGRGALERQLTIKDVSGKVGASLAGGRGTTEITDISLKGKDMVLKFQQEGRGETMTVIINLSMQSDGTLKVNQEMGQLTMAGTGKRGQREPTSRR